MSHSDEKPDQDFVMSDATQTEETADSNEYDGGDATSWYVRKPSMLPAIFSGVGFLVLIILAIAILSRTQDLAENEQLKALESRIEQLERSLAGGTDTDPQGPGLSNSEKQFALLTERLDRVEANVNSKIDQMMAALNNRKQTAAQQAAPAAKTPPPPQKEKKTIKPKTHKVQAGETLYRIGQRYGLTVTQLREYNKLGANEKIYPGQEIKLAP
jgi:LysM repeat protein